jgi:hypothetical protein
MRHTNLIRIALAAAMAALAIAAIPALAGAKDNGRDDHGRHEHGRHHLRHIHHFRGEATGTISSFDATTGKLTITATNGDAVTGLVTAATEIRCEGRDDSRFARRDGGGSDNSGPGRGGESEPGDDNGGRGEPEPGDDHGVREPEPGDDHGEDGTGAGATCLAASLVTGAVVEEADVVVRQGASFFDEIELAHTS